MKNSHFFFGLALSLSAAFLVACGVGNGSFLSIGINSWISSPSQNTHLSNDFQEFVENFPKTKFPLQIDEQTISFFKTGNSGNKDKVSSEKPSWKKRLITDKFSAFVPSLGEERFSRVPVYSECQYVSNLAETSQFVALLYSVASSYGDYRYDEEMGSSPTRFILATYTPSGKIIDEKVIAYYDGTNLTTAKIDKRLKIKSIRIEGNDKYEAVYQISKNGKIEALKDEKLKEEDRSRTDYVF
ncbi:MAG: hypothetical protein OHK0045_06130 [Raineya sp.]